MRESYRVVGLTQGSYCEENPTNHRMATNNICIDAQTLSSAVAGVVSQILQTRPGAQPLQSPAPNTTPATSTQTGSG